MEDDAAGVIRHTQVDDAAAALQRARRHGARPVHGPTRADRTTESAMIDGPEEIVGDLHRGVDSRLSAQLQRRAVAGRQRRGP